MKLFYKYCIFCAIFMTLAIIVNVCFGGNMMFFATPSGIPIKLLFSIYDFSHVLYTIIMIIAHLSLGLIVIGIYKLVERIMQNHKNKITQADVK